MKKFVLITAVVACCSMPSAYADLLANGSFDAQNVMPTYPLVPGWDFQTMSGSALTGWTITQGDVDLVGTYWKAFDGANSVDLDGNTQGTISQSFATTIGQEYLLTFEMSGNPDTCSPPCVKDMNMTVNVATTPYAFTINSSQTHSNMNWQTESISFVASAATTTLSFASTTSGNFGIVLDKVAVVAVPESETWAMLLVGLGLVGLRLRKSKRREGRLLS